MSKELGPTLTSITPYDAKPGEASVNGYVFQKTFEKPSGKSQNTSVSLTKFGKEYRFSVPMKKGEKGELAEDPDILAAIGKLQEGNSVWVKTAGSKLVIIEPYNDPLLGKLDKLSTTEVNGVKIPSADIQTDDGKTITVLVPGTRRGKMFVVDSAVSAELHKIKPSSAVQFWSHDDGENHVWLREISLAPKASDTPPPAAPTKKETPNKKKPAA